jgi:hypothetical protein
VLFNVNACKADVPLEIVRPFVPVINPDAFIVVVVNACKEEVPVDIVNPLVPVINPDAFIVVHVIACVVNAPAVVILKILVPELFLYNNPPVPISRALLEVPIVGRKFIVLVLALMNISFPLLVSVALDNVICVVASNVVEVTAWNAEVPLEIVRPFVPVINPDAFIVVDDTPALAVINPDAVTVWNKDLPPAT